MPILFWWIAAVVAGLAVAALGLWAVARGAPRRSAEDQPLPVTPLQRISRGGLSIGALLTAGLIGMVLYFGPERLAEDDPVRIAFTLVLLLILVVFSFLALRVAQWVRRDDGVLDERDRAILGRSHALRSVAMLVTLVVWVIGLQESFWAEGAVPVFYLNLMFWSVLLVSLLTFPLGILFAYRRP